MQLKQYIVDAFTQTLFGGNPAAVVVLPAFLSDDLMQQMAVENNLSETVFVVPQGQKYQIRWFSPLTEIEFCGHASLASAYVLHHFYGAGEHIVFECALLGEFTIEVQADGLIRMAFPKREAAAVASVPEALLNGLSHQPQQVLRSAQAYFAIYDDEQAVRDVTINAALLKTLAPYDVVVTAASTQEFDFISRYFWPANGGDEDPVTGSIYAGLFPYWSERLGKTNLCAKQVSKRGGVVYGEVQAQKVLVSGYACLFAQCELFVQTAVSVNETSVL
ncbi:MULTISPECIES: PhzF family phenazine biosynthesis protein [Vitreoscilla]|uniref:PhzF family phenazine biosynthesis protein n=1 Tax=Vitreoscilla stercoraria TaxID=61 RepID=A0ABY4EA62_VITST|nr:MULTISPECIES: PhzF family phenazine biosynthesis protein [Vitreoscilla]AUZ04919.2 phenazine biosynthesis protein PhzF [Vitreoscilla sp. C1]UOO91428.1 PhzF family phenazine biosynthesis protein [Vitreoscilla stercoraria]